MMKRIIILSPHNPFLRSNGAENRIYLIMNELAKNNYVSLICPEGRTEKITNVKVYQEFKDKASQKTFNYNLIKRFKEIIDEVEPDEIQLETPFQAINLWVLRLKYNLVEHNIEFLRFRRVKSFLWPGVFLNELIACKLASKIICVSDYDKVMLAKIYKLSPSKIEVTENPVDSVRFFPNDSNINNIRNKLGLKKEETSILFFGQLDYAPNIEALWNIRNEIIPRLDNASTAYKIVVCGKGDGKGFLKMYRHPNLIFLGFVNRIEDYINASDVVIAPLNSGSGTRIKILEALACNKRVISTTIGAEGINNESLLVIKDDWGEFVNMIKGGSVEFNSEN